VLFVLALRAGKHPSSMRSRGYKVMNRDARHRLAVCPASRRAVPAVRLWSAWECDEGSAGVRVSVSHGPLPSHIR
jgi:hypothetical protein